MFQIVSSFKGGNSVMGSNKKQPTWKVILILAWGAGCLHRCHFRSPVFRECRSEGCGFQSFYRRFSSHYSCCDYPTPFPTLAAKSRFPKSILLWCGGWYLFSRTFCHLDHFPLFYFHCSFHYFSYN